MPNIDDFPASAAPGTPSYFSPELHAGALGDVQSDLFALGVFLYQSAFAPTGIRVFFRAPPSANADLPSWLDHVLMRMIAAKPADRYFNAPEFIFDLKHGALHVTPRRRSMIERDKLRFWQTLAAIPALQQLASAALHLR
jgi:serine/threonine protein kinase